MSCQLCAYGYTTYFPPSSLSSTDCLPITESPTTSPTRTPTTSPTSTFSKSPSFSPSSSPTLTPSVQPTLVSFTAEKRMKQSDIINGKKNPSWAHPLVLSLISPKLYIVTFFVGDARVRVCCEWHPTQSPTERNLTGLAAGDPHIMGANHESYMFKGIAGGIYSLFSSPQFHLTMQVSGGYLMKEIGLMFRHENFLLNVSEVPPRGVLEKQLIRAKTGKLLEWSPSKYSSSDFVPRTNSDYILSERNNTYLDANSFTEGCIDSNGGALGVTYMCKYASGKEHFQWSSQEAEFKIPKHSSLRAEHFSLIRHATLSVGESSGHLPWLALSLRHL